MKESLIIEIPYGGMGDHLFHSHIPRIAKEYGNYKKVYISERSLFRHPDNKRLIWELNPFVDGFTDDYGVSVKLEKILKEVNQNKGKYNLLDAIMLAFELDNKKRFNEPEVHYKPKYVSKHNKIIYDPNFLSWVGEITRHDVMRYFIKNNILFDAIMKIRTENALYICNGKEHFIDTPSLEQFCDLIYSTKKLYCLTSGTATLAAALGKPAIVFYGENQDKAFRHSKIHKYNLIRRPLIKRKISRLRQLMKS